MTAYQTDSGSVLLQHPNVAVKTRRDAAPWLVSSLSALSPVALVGLIVQARQNGSLEFRDGAGTRTLFFEQGHYTGATSTHVADRLGEVMWRMGNLSLDQLMIATELVSQGKKLGQVLVELGFLRPGALRAALVGQAMAIFEAACLERSGYAFFTQGPKHTMPMRFDMDTSKLMERTHHQVEELTSLESNLPALHAPCTVSSPVPQGTLNESEHAILQLAASSKHAMTGTELITRSALGRLHGLRALNHLVVAHYLQVPAPKAEEPHPDASRISHLCEGINLAIAALDEGGFGVGDMVREYLANPPAAFEDALSGLSLDQPLESEAAIKNAAFVPGGTQAVAAALVALLDDARMQARDTLPKNRCDALEAQLLRLGV